MLNVEAVFDSIDGEVNGFFNAGELTTFLRMKGCNLNCTYCDTVYAQDLKEGKVGFIEVDELLEKYQILPKVTITGGEPLIQPNFDELVNKLVMQNHNITIETNGSMMPSLDYFRLPHLRNKVRFVVDYKMESSGETDKMVSRLFRTLDTCDVMKCVVSNVDEFEKAIELSQYNTWDARVVFSPAIDDQNDYTGWPQTLASMMIERAFEIPHVQYSLQIHKVLYPNSKTER